MYKYILNKLGEISIFAIFYKLLIKYFKISYFIRFTLIIRLNQVKFKISSNNNNTY